MDFARELFWDCFLPRFIVVALNMIFLLVVFIPNTKHWIREVMASLSGIGYAVCTALVAVRYLLHL